MNPTCIIAVVPFQVSLQDLAHGQKDSVSIEFLKHQIALAPIALSAFIEPLIRHELKICKHRVIAKRSQLNQPPIVL